MGLPIKTTTDDVEKIVSYLKTKPTGATVQEAKAVLDSKYLDGRKIRGYVTWGLVTDFNDRLALTEDGWRIAREPEKTSDIYQSVIDRIRPYRAAMEWAHHQDFDVLNLADLAANWHTHHAESLGTSNENTIKDAVTCFFGLADGANLGTYKLGRAGSQTRLELNRDAINRFIDSGPSTPPWSGPDLERPEVGDTTDEEHQVETLPVDAVPGTPPSLQQSGTLRVFIAHGQNMRVVEQVKTMLELANISAEVAEEEETTAVPVPGRVLSAMRRSDAGIICVSVDESRKRDDGHYTLNENVLIEIGAAFVLYDQKVILLWDRRLTVPSNLQGLYRCEYEGDEIGWDAGMKLMKAVSKFREPDAPAQ